MGENTYSGGCLCGAVRYEVSGSPRNLCFCHCESCRRAAGAPAVPWGTFPRGGFRARCGSSLTYRHDARPGETDVTLATLDEPARLAPQMHVWVGDKLPWESISDGLPQLMAGAGPRGLA